jgi:hypothetical protein
MELLQRAESIPKEWLPPLPGGFQWWRGFPWRWTGIDSGSFVAHATRVLDAVPTVTAVEVRLPNPLSLPALLGAPVLARLRDLSLPGEPARGRVGMGDGGAAQVAACPHLQGLMALHLAGNDLGAAGVHAVVNALPRLETLSLANNEVGTEGCDELARRSWVALDLSLNRRIDTAALAALIRRPQVRLVSLSLDACQVGAAGAWALVQSENVPALRTVDLGGVKPSRSLLAALKARFPEVRL